VRILPDGRLEIIAPEAMPVAAWLTDLEAQIRAVMEDKPEE
jgi:hypothetical protein